MDVMDRLHEIASELHALDADGLGDGELHALVVRLQQERARLGVVAAKLVAAWDAREVWALDGSRSPAHRLARDTASSLRSARREVRRARDLRVMPSTEGAVLDGSLSLDHVDLLGAARRGRRSAVFDEHEAALVEQCAGLRHGDAVTLVRYWMQQADVVTDTEDGAPPTPPAGDEQSVHCSTILDGTVIVDGTLDALGGELFRLELERLTDQIRLADRRAGIDRAPAARRAAALVEMARRSATAPAGGKAPHVVLQVLVGDERVRHLCELANGTVLEPAQLAGWLDDATMESILFDGPSTVIAVSQQRTFTGALRTAIQVRDRRCQHPSGCDVPASRCDVDHIVPYAAGGPTSQFNGRLECPTHNRHADKHDHGAEPFPSRAVDVLDALRCRARWRYLQDLENEPPDDEDP